MGLRYRKSFKIAPGVKVNLGKKSAGLSVGNKYAGVSMNSRTGTTARISAPGSGISYTEKISSAPSKGNHISNNSNTSVNQKDKWTVFVLCLFFGFWGVHKFYERKIGMGILYLFTFGLFFFGWFVDLIIILCRPANKEKQIKTDPQEAMMAEQYLKILNDSVNIFNSTKKPDIFFSRYKLAQDQVEKLCAFTTVKYDGQHPEEIRKLLIEKKNAATHDMIERFFEDTEEKAGNLKTKTGKLNRYHSFIMEMEKYFLEIDSNNVQYAQELYNKAIEGLV